MQCDAVKWSSSKAITVTKKIHPSGETEDKASQSLCETITGFLISFALVKAVFTQFMFLTVMLTV